MVDYPEYWEADVVLSDGGTAHLRPTGRADTEALRAMHSRMSSRTKYLRYFAAVGEVSDRQLSIYTEVDHEAAVGFVVELGGQVIAAANYHRIPGTADAEVAFVVEDAHQSRGLGSILLEHLADAARERGIRRFTAEVLADNPQMRRVFSDAGYAVSRMFDEGVLELSFAIEPTEKSLDVMYSRERRSEARSIERMLSPRSIAVLGACADPHTLGHAVLANLADAGFTGPVYPVHPDVVAVPGLTSYRALADVAAPVDLAVVAETELGVVDLIRSAKDAGVHALVVVGDGPAEQRPGHRELVAAARANGMRVLGPNCLGLVNTDRAVRMNATLAPRVPGPGRLGFFCQSGALGIAVLAEASARGIGLSSFASAGGRADVSGNDLLQFWYDDQRTEVVLLWLESFGNPRKFARLARALASRKPVIALKSGRHALVSPGLAASSAEVSASAVETLFAQSGVLRVDTLTQAFDLTMVLAHQPLPAGDRVAIIANSTALGILALDACLDRGLQVAGGRPIDLGIAVDPAMLAFTARSAIYDEDVDAVVVVYVPPVATDGLQHADALRAAVANAAKPVVSTFLAVPSAPEHLGLPDPDGGLARGSVPSYPTPERAVAAVSGAVRYAHWLDQPTGELTRPAGIDADRARELVDGWRAVHPAARALTVEERVELLACYGIGVLDFRKATSLKQVQAAAAELGYPVAVKTTDEALRHRDDRTGVRLDLAESEIAGAYAEITLIAGPEVYVQAMATRDKSTARTVFGIKADPSFGALVWFGLGGMATELLDDRAYRAVPLSDLDAADLITAPGAAALLTGYRGSDPVDLPALADLAWRLSALADDLAEILELNLQPVLVGPAGAVVTGTNARIGPPPRWMDASRRMR